MYNTVIWVIFWGVYIAYGFGVYIDTMDRYQWNFIARGKAMSAEDLDEAKKNALKNSKRYVIYPTIIGWSVVLFIRYLF